MARWLEAGPASGFIRFPPTLIVPLGEAAYVVLENATNCTVAALVPTAVQIQQSFLVPRLLHANQRLIEVTGRTPGSSAVRATAPNGQVYAELRVIVKIIKRWKLKFHFVEDSANHRTRRTPENFEPLLHGGLTVAQTIQQMNRIYKPQAALEMVSLGTTRARFSTDLGRMILDRTSTTPAAIPPQWGEWHYIKSNNDPNANLNFYFVWRVEQSDAGTRSIRRLFRSDSADALTELGGDTGIFEDGMPANCFVSSLCHETGHSLGLPDVNNDSARHRVMYGITSPNHPLFTLAEIQKMNP